MTVSNCVQTEKGNKTVAKSDQKNENDLASTDAAE